MNDISINIDCSDFRSVKEKFLYDINETNFLEGALANISVKISARTSARQSLVMRPPAFGKPLTLRMMQVFFNIQQQKAGSPDVAETEIGAGQSLVGYGGGIRNKAGLLSLEGRSSSRVPPQARS